MLRSGLFHPAHSAAQELEEVGMLSAALADQAVAYGTADDRSELLASARETAGC
jgi:hypothetical protein